MRHHWEREKARGLEPMHGPYERVRFATGLRTAGETVRARRDGPIAAVGARPGPRAVVTRATEGVAA